MRSDNPQLLPIRLPIELSVRGRVVSLVIAIMALAFVCLALIAKVSGISIPWVWVFSPLWIPAAVVAIVILICAAAALIQRWFA
jgi:hypothetical protein